MALVNAETARGFQHLPALRQVGLMIGLAASVALGVAIVLWSQKPNYAMLYGSLDSKDAGEVIDALQASDIEFTVDQSTGAIMVSSSQLRTARMQLARDGLPQGNSMGFELLQEDQGFGTSQFIETKRYQRALEGELGRTISELRNVNAARVHLAIPKRSVFLRERSNPTASVMLELYSGRTLNEEQIAAIVHLVSSSVPHLEAENVTIVDQKGNLLSSRDTSGSAAPTSSQFSYNRKLEHTYSKRILDLLEPIVGAGKVRASINADLDFTVTERTEETYNPDLAALRSEQTSEDQSVNGAGASGIPGALSNQPPEDATLQDPNAGAQGTGAGQQTGVAPVPRHSSKSMVRNYELDKTISHTRLASGTIRRLSIAVVIDNKQELDDNDEVVSKPWTDAEMTRYTMLVKEAVGFNAQRGDTVNIINSSFITPPELEEIPEQSLMEKPWLWDIVKQLIGAIGVIIVAFGVLKPVMRKLAEKGAQGMQESAMLPAGAAAGQAGLPQDDQLSLSGASAQQGQLEAPLRSYEQHLETAQGVVKEDPRRVAQVVKNWVSEDG